MFCGGVFISKPASGELFLCADGIEMSQSQLLSTVKGVTALIQEEPLDPRGMRVLLIEAATTLVRPYKGCVFGVSTYQAISVPVLSATIERVFSCANLIFGPEMDIGNLQNRATFYLAMKSLLTDSPSVEVGRDIRQSFNIPLDVSVNVGSSRVLVPKAGGEFDILFNGGKTAPEPVKETNTHKSCSDSVSSFEVERRAQSDSDSSACRGTIDVRLLQTVEFNVRDGIRAEDFACDCEVNVKAMGAGDCGALEFAVIPATKVLNSKVNTSVIREGDDGIYTCDRPLELLNEPLAVLVFESPLEPELAPFNVKCRFSRAEGRGRIEVEIESRYAMAQILAGLGKGFRNAVSDTNEIRMANDNLLMEFDMIPIGGGRVTGVVYGDVDEDYVPPEFVQIKCILRGTSLGGLTVKTRPEGKFSVRNITYDIDVTRSRWAFRE